MGKKKKTPMKKTPIKRPPVASPVSDPLLGTSLVADLNKKPSQREGTVRGDLANPVSNPDSGIKNVPMSEVVTTGYVGGAAGVVSGVVEVTSDPPRDDIPEHRNGVLPEAVTAAQTDKSSNPSGSENSTEVVAEHGGSNLPDTLATGTLKSVSVDGGGKPQNASERKKTWAECVTGKTGSLQKRGDYYKLDTGATCVTIPNAVISRNKKAWTSFVLGQFHGTLPSMGALHAILNGIWSSKNRDISISRCGDQSILIKIPSSITRRRVLAQGIWHIEGQSMFVGEWEPGLKPEIPELKEVPVWVDFKGVPPHFFSTEGLEYIAGMVGQPLQLHPRTAAMTNLEVARVFMLVDLRESLPEAVYVRFESGDTHKIDVSYPWLPPLCSHCQKYGHSLRRCPTAPITCKICKSTTHEESECTRGKRRNTNPPKPTLRRRDRNEKADQMQGLPQQVNLDSQDEEAHHASVAKKVSPQEGHVAVVNPEIMTPSEQVPEQIVPSSQVPTSGYPLEDNNRNGVLAAPAPCAENISVNKEASKTTNPASQYEGSPTCKESLTRASSFQQQLEKGKQRISSSSSEESNSESDLEDFPKLSKMGGLKKNAASTNKTVTQGKSTKGRGPLVRKKH